MHCHLLFHLPVECRTGETLLQVDALSSALRQRPHSRSIAACKASFRGSGAAGVFGYYRTLQGTISTSFVISTICVYCLVLVATEIIAIPCPTSGRSITLYPIPYYRWQYV